MVRLILALAATLHAVPASPASRAEVEALAEAMLLPELIEIMRLEGLDHGGELQSQMMLSRGGAWDEAVSAIYDAEAMEEAVLEAMVEGLATVDADPLLDFFASPRGQEIMSYEISARRAFLDEDVEEAAEERLAGLRAEDDPHLALIERFVEINDLVESNVMGAMNSTYAFYLGLSESGALDDAMGEGEILAEVWSQEESIREETDLWVHAYLAMAYQPLGATDLEAYLALSETEEGRALNRALFEGFDAMYVAISRALGVAAGNLMAGQDI